MNYDEFMQSIADEIKDYLPEQYQEADIRIQHVTKHNDKELDGMVILLPDSNIAPNIYLNSYFEDYQNGRNIGEIMEEIAQIRLDNAMDSIDTSGWKQWENVKDKIMAHVCSAEDNEHRLENTPYTAVEDLAVTYHIIVDGEDFKDASLPVTNQLLEQLGVSVEDLHNAALENMNHEGNIMFTSMNDTIREMMMEDIPPGMSVEEAEEMIDAMLGQSEFDTFILTNDSKLNGAALIVNDDIRQMVAEQVGGDYFVLPSSIHECMIVPMELGMSYEELQNMVQDINRSQLAPEDRLSDHVYEYNALAHEFSRSDQAQERRAEREESVKENLKREEAADRPSLKEKLEAKKIEAAGAVKDSAFSIGQKIDHKKEAVMA